MWQKVQTTSGKRDGPEAMSLWHKAELCQGLQPSFGSRSNAFVAEQHSSQAHGGFFLCRVKQPRSILGQHIVKLLMSWLGVFACYCYLLMDIIGLTFGHV